MHQWRREIHTIHKYTSYPCIITSLQTISTDILTDENLSIEFLLKEYSAYRIGLLLYSHFEVLVVNFSYSLLLKIYSTALIYAKSKYKSSLIISGKFPFKHTTFVFFLIKL